VSGLIADYFALSVALLSTRVVADQPVMHAFDPYLEQIERDRGTDHCDEHAGRNVTASCGLALSPVCVQVTASIRKKRTASN
jgi:hypothetical protein